MNSQAEHFDLSRHAWQTFLLSRISGKYSKIFSMAFVMGRPSAQEILLKVHEDLNESSGVYAIVDFTSFQNAKRAADELDSPFVNLNISLMFKQNENH